MQPVEVQNPRITLERFEKLDAQFKVAWNLHGDRKLTDAAFVKCLEGLQKGVRGLGIASANTNAINVLGHTLNLIKEGQQAFILFEVAWASIHGRLIAGAIPEEERVRHRAEVDCRVDGLLRDRGEELLEPLLRM